MWFLLIAAAFAQDADMPQEGIVIKKKVPVTTQSPIGLDTTVEAEKNPNGLANLVGLPTSDTNGCGTETFADDRISGKRAHQNALDTQACLRLRAQAQEGGSALRVGVAAAGVKVDVNPDGTVVYTPAANGGNPVYVKTPLGTTLATEEAAVGAAYSQTGVGYVTYGGQPVLGQTYSPAGVASSYLANQDRGQTPTVVDGRTRGTRGNAPTTVEDSYNNALETWGE